MHPKHWINDEEQDSIAKAHIRLDELFAQRLEENPEDATATMLAALHHRVLWLGTYINDGALDEQISDRVRAEAKHFWLALEEATLKLKALSELGARVDRKLDALDRALELLEVQDRIINEAVPASYKLRVRRLHAAVKQALAA
jgi:hypothetical protein